MTSQQGQRSRPIYNAVMSRFRPYGTSDAPSEGVYDSRRFKMPPMKTVISAGVGNLGDDLRAYIEPVKSGAGLDDDVAN